MYIMNKEEPESVHTVDSEVSGSASSKTFSSGGIAEAERWVGNENKKPESVNTVDSEVSSPANSKAFSSTDTAEDEMLWVKEEQPQRVTWSLKSHNNYSVLDKVMNVLNKGSLPTGAVPKKKESKGEPKNKTSIEVSEPLAKCDNCRTIPCLDNQFITPKNLVIGKDSLQFGKKVQISDFKGSLGGKTVTGMIQIDHNNPHPRFRHYINGARQTWDINGEKQEWAIFTSDITTLKYRCKR